MIFWVTQPVHRLNQKHWCSETPAGRMLHMEMARSRALETRACPGGTLMTWQLGKPPMTWQLGVMPVLQ